MWSEAKRVEPIIAQEMEDHAIAMAEGGIFTIPGTPWTSVYAVEEGTMWHLDNFKTGLVAVSSCHEDPKSWHGGELVFDSGVAFKMRSGDVVVSRAYKTTYHGSTRATPGRWAITCVMDMRTMGNGYKCIPSSDTRWRAGRQMAGPSCPCEDCGGSCAH